MNGFAPERLERYSGERLSAPGRLLLPCSRPGSSPPHLVAEQGIPRLISPNRISSMTFSVTFRCTAHPVFADFLQHYGAVCAALTDKDALERMGRLFWFTVEFGVIRQKGGYRLYGSGLISSQGESSYVIEVGRKFGTST